MYFGENVCTFQVYDPITVTETDTPPIAQPPFTGIQYLLVNHEPAADIFRIDHTSTGKIEESESLLKIHLLIVQFIKYRSKI